MKIRPKRRKHKDNPYTLGLLDEINKYTVSFKDGQNKYHIVEINESIYNILDSFELEDKKEMNEYDNHIEHSEVFENTLNKKAINRPILLEEVVEKNIVFEELYSYIEDLPEIQKRRLKKYYFEEKTFEEIAKEEQCTKRAVKFSVDIAIQKIQKKYQN